MKEYTRLLARQGLEPTRVRTPTGVTDLYIAGHGETEIIEAKSTARHSHVREALGQLLDYAPDSPTPATRLAALFPQSPAYNDIQLLHRYGVDCIYRVSGANFARQDAPDERRSAMREIWN